MIRLGLRLTVGGGREAAARLAIIAAAVALGVGLLLGTLAAIGAIGTQNSRGAWFNSGSAETAPAPAPATGSTVDPLWWHLDGDRFEGRLIGRLDLAATGPHSPLPPGLPRLPGPGEFYASPALGRLLATTPADELAARYPGRQVGTIGDAALPGPDSLVIVIGHRPDELAGARDARQVTSIVTASDGSCGNPSCLVGLDNNGMDLTLSVVAAALVFPVLVLIGTATRLSATRREQRFAAMRLVGATPRQISVLSAVESTAAAVLGTAAGFVLFLLAAPLLARIDFTGTLFFPGDLTLPATDVVLVALGVPAAAAVSARIALRGVRISPLGVARRVTPRPPRAWRVIPLAAGLLELTYLIGRVPTSSDDQVRVFLPGILLVLGGLVLAGPWLTMLGARLMTRGAGRPTTLIAGRRLSDDPKAGFRAVSGLVLALCVTSTAVGVIGALAAERGVPRGGPIVSATVVGGYQRYDGAGHPAGGVATPPDAVLAGLRAIPGVRGVTVNHLDPTYAWGTHAGLGGGLADCAQLTATAAFGTCPAGAEAARVNSSFLSIGLRGTPPWPATWPATTTSAEQLRGLPVQEIAVATDGSSAAVERARTVLANAYPGEQPAITVAEDRAQQAANLDADRRLADVVVAISFPIAGCSLAVSVAGGLSDRRRPFSLLRLTGVRLGVLRRIVLLESALPLVVVATVAIGTGFLTAQLFLRAQFGYSVRAPGTAYYLTIGGGLAVALGVITATLPLLSRLTGPEMARNE
ncbi:ABC transporter permease [Kitasatospora nipponensis]|uniref:ABC transporter permease n=1 Tax=Kitasatospora nipponensis TaxID=258049 RepID=A0ABP4H3H2_9ACTN